jgi:hypothetical protein
VQGRATAIAVGQPTTGSGSSALPGHGHCAPKIGANQSDTARHQGYR